MLCIYSPLEAEFFPALRVFYGDVIFARTVDFQPGPGKRLEHIRTISNKPLFDIGPQVFMNGILGGGSVILAWSFAPAEQTGIVQIGMFRRMQADAGRVVRSGPAFPMVVHVAEHVEMLLPARRARVERLSAG